VIGGLTQINGAEGEWEQFSFCFGIDGKDGHMLKQILRSLWLGLALIAGIVTSVVFTSLAQAQQFEFGAWIVSCETNAPYQYTFCNVYSNKTLSDDAGDVARFGVTRTLGIERVAIVALKGLAAGSKVVLSIDKSHTWTFEAPTPTDIGVLVPTAESKKIIDQMLMGKTVTVALTPDGRAQQELQVSLASFPEALKNARAKAK
jgi:invasion protein IalB